MGDTLHSWSKRMLRNSFLRALLLQAHIKAGGTIVLHTVEQSYEEMEERLRRVIQGGKPSDKSQK